jgi:ATPase family associated with various cellular activities (AAA)
MTSKDGLYIAGIPDEIPERVAAVCRSRLLKAVQELLPHIDIPELLVQVGTAAAFKQNGSHLTVKPQVGQDGDSDMPNPDRYAARPPYFTFEQLILPLNVMSDLLASIEVLRVESKVFDDWGLRQIEPFPRTALNFHGRPGTGKTLAAHAIAHRLNRNILVASYAEIESKFHGDGPKNVKAIFQAAERDDAVLFIDEADSLLSRRLMNVTQGSEQAINSMRSQLLICLEQFHGIVVFSTNLVQSYDKAFETRVQNIYFPMPDLECRREIWRQHLLPKLPLDTGVDPRVLAETCDDICGRDIKNAVIDAAVRAAVADQDVIALGDLISAVERIKAARISEDKMTPLTEEETKKAEGQIRAALHKKDEKHEERQ